MIIYTIFILFLIQFDCGFSEEKRIKNVQQFNEFVELLFKTNDQTERDNGKTTIPVNYVAKILDFMNQHVAREILMKHSNGMRLKIDEVNNK